ncbi:hypothetical protein FYJ24_09365 [Actinomycetaceae bacterium WB03_NA08]|uniref:Uncharacterized protein n=1 Tax=Scrofimicrobium canadense TaxID=2652290 RepID=A0A6N7VT60_9ACTO|nr:hypothetical protein [Scrofimicrobium canadense]MSS84967.1 hypothetical protein [Scrofimicrobium canadense]
MAADEQGNDLSAVPVPIGGIVAFAPYASANVIADTMIGQTPLELPEAYDMLGLVKQDGAPQHQRESGDALEFWQKGYVLPGDGTRSFVVNAAENNAAVLKLTEGKEPDANGVIYVDSSLPEAKWLIFLATKFKNGTEDRYNGAAQVTEIEIDQDTRGEVRGRSVTLTWQEDPLFKDPKTGLDKPFKMWHGTPASKNTPPPGGDQSGE